MTDTNDFDRIDELIALAALGELTEAEAAELDLALAADDEVAAELAADLTMAADLQAIHREAPPAALKDSVMAAIDGLAQGVPAAGDPRGGDNVHHDGAAISAEPAWAPPDVPTIAAAREARSERRNRRWQPLAAAAAVVMLLVGGVLVANRDSGSTDTFDAIVQADDAQARTLEGALAGTLDVVYSPSQQAFVLSGTNIPGLTDAETYQLWFVDDSGAQPIGLFRPDGSGEVNERFDDLDPTDFIVGVTVEPAEGSETPTLPIVAAA